MSNRYDVTKGELALLEPEALLSKAATLDVRCQDLQDQRVELQTKLVLVTRMLETMTAECEEHVAVLAEHGVMVAITSIDLAHKALATVKATKA